MTPLEEWAASLRDLLGARLGKDLGRFIHEPYGHGNTVFSLPDYQPPLIVKTSRNPEAFKHSASNIEAIRGAGVPVPGVVCSGVGANLAYLVLRRIPGRDLGHALAEMTTGERMKLAAEVVGIQRKVNDLGAGRSFGWGPLGGGAEFRSWSEVVWRDLQKVREPYREPLIERFDKNLSLLESVLPVPFLDDITVKNVIVDAGRLSGIVDLDAVCFGDPLYWLALTETTVVLDVGEQGADYSAELKRLSQPWSSQVFNLYRAVFCGQFLSQDLNDRARVAMERLFEESLTCEQAPR